MARLSSALSNRPTVSSTFPAPPSFKFSRLVCMAVRLADRGVVSNPTEYQKLAQSMAELDEVVLTYQRFKNCEKQLKETKALEKVNSNDPDMAEI